MSSDSCSGPDADAIFDTEKTSIGGSALTEKTELAVRATGPWLDSNVTTATPDGWCLKAALNDSGVELIPSA